MMLAEKYDIVTAVKRSCKTGEGQEMSFKFDSMITVLNKLDRKDKVTVQSLQEDLETSERTVHRYLTTLEVAGFPIYYDRKKGSYLFTEGFSLQKPGLTLKETLALALAKKLMSDYAPGMEEELLRIEEKLSGRKAVLPDHIILKAEPPTPVVRECLTNLHQAITDFKRIEIGYRTLQDGEESVRKVDPYYLFFSEGFWCLRGFCHLRKELRTFAIDRIESLKVLKENFLPSAISPEDELSGAFGAFVDGEPVDVVLRFDAVCKNSILRKKWHQSQEEKVLRDGRVEIRFTVNGIEGIKSWIYQWIPHVEVIEPEELRRIVRKELKEEVNKHKQVN